MSVPERSYRKSKEGEGRDDGDPVGRPVAGPHDYSGRSHRREVRQTS